jgi:hypothetical protein
LIAVVHQIEHQLQQQVSAYRQRQIRPCLHFDSGVPSVPRVAALFHGARHQFSQLYVFPNDSDLPGV